MEKLFFSVLSLFLLSSSTFALRGGSWQQGQCHIRRINAQQPSYRIDAEGGYTEFWDNTNDEFQCAGVSIHRHHVRSRALMLPAYHNFPVLVYVVRGRGVFGVMVSGCPETYETSQQSQQQYSEERGQEERGSRSFRDKHQKIGHFRQGDIIAIPAGAPHWSYNDGDQELVLVVLSDISNNVNQLDQTPRCFFLAGNPARGQEQYQGGRQQKQQYGSRHQMGNVLRGFVLRTLVESFKIDEETARKLQGQDDQRGHIVVVERGLQVIRPPIEEEYGRREEQAGAGGRPNGLDETICTAKLRENIDNPARADVFNPQGGRFTTVNSYTLPILSFLQLSAARGVLYQNAIMSPHWWVNAHTIVYVTRGDAQIQIVNHRGEAVFDGQVSHGQVVVVPQNFAVVKRAGDQGFEWVEFNTNANAMINTLSGRTSALKGLPASVLSNAYQISEEQALRLKNSRQETLIFSGGKGRAASS